ncbi:hypothetical protein [Saccharicrinis sp. FJH54]|uniref:hypothetical protein n=1 Tax=Saccharicrinis sp. FJH54 TaxID=3344665 RepID=UPI0035D3FB32
MGFNIDYRILFKINVFHHYYLDKGGIDFDTMSDIDKEKQLQQYATDVFLSIRPDAKTRGLLSGHRLLFKNTRTGFMVLTSMDGSKPGLPLEDNLEFTFLIHLKDPDFFSYTKLEIENSGNLYYFSNTRLNSEPASFPLIKLSGNTDRIDSGFVIQDATTMSERNNLYDSEILGLFGIIRIGIKGENNTLNLLSNTGELPATPVSFVLNFENRHTFWRYRFDKDQPVNPSDDVEPENGNPKILVTKTTHPLTLNGFVNILKSGRQLPNPDLFTFVPDIPNDKYYSEIYM